MDTKTEAPALSIAAVQYEDNHLDEKGAPAKVDQAVISADGESALAAEAQSKDSNGDSIEGAANAQEEDYGMRGFKLLAIMTAITLSAFLILLDSTILATALPRITTDFHSITDIGWYGAAYQLSAAALQPLSGKFYVNFSSKWTFIVFLAIFEIGSLLCATAPSSVVFIIGRAIAGSGTAGFQNGAFTILSGCVPLHRRPPLIGTVQGIAQLGVVVGPLIGGVLTQYTTWRWCFYINFPCGGVVLALLVFLHIPEQAPKMPPLVVLRDLHNRVDLPGFALFAPACIMLLLAVQWGGNEYPWNSSVIIGLFVGSGVNAIVWLAWNAYRKDTAMIPLSLLKRNSIWTGCLSLGFLFGPLYTASYYLPVYFQSVKGISPSRSGIYLLPSIGTQLISAIMAGKLLQKVGYYLPFSALSNVLMSIGYGLMTTLAPGTSNARWIGYQILFGVGRGIGFQMPVVAIQANCAPQQQPIALSLAFFTSTFFGALGLSFADTIFTNSLRDRLSAAFTPSVVASIIASGGTGFRALISSSQLPAVLNAYSIAVDRVFYLLVACVIAGFFTAWGMGWKDIRKKKAPSKV